MPTPVKVLLIGCGTLLVLGIGGCFVFVLYVSNLPEAVEVTVDAPGRVEEGEAFEIVARVRNTGQKPRTLVDLDLADEYLEGIAITDTEPDHTDSMHVPIDNTVSYSFGMTVEPGDEAVVTFQAHAAHAGDWSGDFDFCIDSVVRCLPRHVRTVVTPAP